MEIGKNMLGIEGTRDKFDKMLILITATLFVAFAGSLVDIVLLILRLTHIIQVIDKVCK